MAITVLRGGRIIDPANGVDQVGDLVVQDDRILGIDVPIAGEAETIDCRGNLVLPGLIDTHAHVFRYVTGRFGLDADTCGVRSGVTTLVDQGGPSCITIPAFRHYVAEQATSRVLAFISAYLVGGLEGHYYPELYRPGCLDRDATVKAALANADLVRGVKAHAEIGGFERWGLEVMRIAAEIGREASLPVYIHFGQLWPSPTENVLPIDPDRIFEQTLELVKPGDVLAHPFSRHPGGFVNARGQVHPLVTEAIARGAKIDVGHGSHFSFAVARHIVDAGILPHTLGADMHGYNTKVPHPPATPEIHPEEGDHMFAGAVRFSLASTMTSMLALGIPLEQVVPMATSNAARMLQMDQEIGHLSAGGVADVTVLHDERGRWTMRDNEGNEAVTDRMLRPRLCLRAGVRFDADAEILPVPLAA
ncbi:amidohydrolase/deacetylase family metallohydrolase [Verticiella sediminum]|uniref:Amidohydrolase/deacetylase family metallohydrolase n=1 Tax=Verticiella sediminum TaxID=1247510 RepID=A0A556A6H1_9BURK|nr:amidohydrolase/deacetylase family metallohydrolase [Verticiella sediminum]TSH88479.1 amidohydrolase/deacetylase family metallohydrolase [Verticiella sediminum]